MEIECPLRSAARECPDLPAVETPDRDFTYSELDALVSGTAQRLLETDLEPGDRVAVLLENEWRSIVCLLAGIRAGLVVCMLSTRLPAATVRPQCARVGAKLLISDLPQAVDSPGSAQEPSAADPVGSAQEPSSANSPGPAEQPSAADPEALIRRGNASAAPLDVEAPATVVFTSGSTGAARAAMHTYGNHYYSALGSNANIALGSGDRWLLALPLYHVGGLAIVFRCLVGRAAVFVPDAGTSLEEYTGRVTHVSMVSTQLRRFLRSQSPHSLKAILLGGSAIPRPLLVEAYDRALPIHTSYGSTEMASQVTTTPPRASLDVLETSGRILPHRELRIDEDGQILVRGRTRFAGYVEGAGLEQPFDAGGWFATRDLGRMDARGFLRVVGRMDNMFISGGENVIPEEIEAALSSLGFVDRVLVVPVDDLEFGQRPVAFVDSRDSPLPQEALREAVERVLPRFMIPVRFYPWPNDVVPVGIKPDRETMRRRAVKLYTED